MSQSCFEVITCQEVYAYDKDFERKLKVGENLLNTQVHSHGLIYDRILFYVFFSFLLMSKSLILCIV